MRLTAAPDMNSSGTPFDAMMSTCNEGMATHDRLPGVTPPEGCALSAGANAPLASICEAKHVFQLCFLQILSASDHDLGPEGGDSVDSQTLSYEDVLPQAHTRRQLSEQFPPESADDCPKHQLLSRCADVAMKRSRQQQITDSATPGAPLVLNIFSTCLGPHQRVLRLVHSINGSPYMAGLQCAV